MAKNKIPKDWIGCPSKGDYLVESKFVVFKTPLSKSYDGRLSAKDRFYPEDLFYNANERPGLWIDLTKTDRYYSKKDIEEQGCIYQKIECEGHGLCPKTRHVNRFISTVQQFLRDSPDRRIGVHCTHGFNRTGFMVVSFLVLVLKHDVAYAIESFAKARPPGIYRIEYIVELLRSHGQVITIAPTVKSPSWIGNPRSSNSTNSSCSSRDTLHYSRYNLPQERLDACKNKSELFLPDKKNQDLHTRESDPSQLFSPNSDGKEPGPLCSSWRSIDSPRDLANNNPRMRKPALPPSSNVYSKGSLNTWKPSPCGSGVSSFSQNRSKSKQYKDRLEDRPKARTSDVPLSSWDGSPHSPEDRLDNIPHQRGVGLYRLCTQPPNLPRVTQPPDLPRVNAFHSYTERFGPFRNKPKGIDDGKL